MELPHNSVRLGGRTFTVEPFDLGQIERVMPLLPALKNVGTQAAFAASLSFLVIAFEPGSPDITEQSIRKLRAAPDEVEEAILRVVTLSGFGTTVQ